jgi:Flp pilus assembly protein TadD
VLFFQEDGFRRAAERTLALYPNNSEALHIVGAMFILADHDSERGLALVDRSISLASNPPGSYFVAEALGLIRRGDYEAAVTAALRFDAPDWHMGHLVLAASAGLAGRREVAERAYARLLELYPTVEQQLPDVFERFRVIPELQEEIRRGLMAAGARSI